jgi:hypothetical protein
MLSSNMVLPNLIPLIDVTFSTPGLIASVDTDHFRFARDSGGLHDFTQADFLSNTQDNEPVTSKADQSHVSIRFTH